MVQENNINKTILIICGPTASGKTSLAIECAKLLNTQIISADSMYIYKGLDIGTAKPSMEEREGIVHHLIDVVNPNQTFTVSDYKALATPIIDKLLTDGKTPIICGGTGFYINSILYDLSYGNGQANLEVREKYKTLANEKGNQYVYNILKELDPESAKKLHFNDIKRVIRALEIYENGCKKSEINDTLIPKYNYKAFSINFDRETLYKRINQRVDIMFNSGLLSEMNTLLKSGITKNDQCMQAIGYKEIFDYYDNLTTLDQVIEKIKLNTRHYAKRQITYFKKFNIEYLSPAEPNHLAKQIVKGLEYDKRTINY